VSADRHLPSYWWVFGSARCSPKYGCLLQDAREALPGDRSPTPLGGDGKPSAMAPLSAMIASTVRVLGTHTAGANNARRGVSRDGHGVAP
jgi:hypothetical protein